MADTVTPPMSFNWIDFATKGGLIGVLSGILILGQMGIWVWGTQLAEAKKDRDEWKAIALKAANLVDPAVRPVGMAPPIHEAIELQGDVQAKLGASPHVQ